MRFPSPVVLAVATVLISCTYPTPVQGRSPELTFLTSRLSRQRCNTLNPKCGLTAAQAQARYLTPYATLVDKLQRLKQNSLVPIQLGPLIYNQTSNNGLLDIDVPLNASLRPCREA